MAVFQCGAAGEHATGEYASRGVMVMKYSPHKIIKRRAKQQATAQGIPLAMALEQLAKQYGFAHNYELAKVAKKNPTDNRLLKAAFGVDTFDDVIYEEPLYTNFIMFIEEEMSGAIAETNAEGFEVEDLHVNRYQYDPQSGLLTLNLSFKYSGSQMPDKPWCGNEFDFLDSRLRLYWRDDQWDFDFVETFEVLESDNDRARDYRDQLADGLI